MLQKNLIWWPSHSRAAGNGDLEDHANHIILYLLTTDTKLAQIYRAQVKDEVCPSTYIPHETV